MFDFKNLIKQETKFEPQIFVDSQPFNIRYSYNDVKELVIIEKHGKIIIQNCKISNLKQSEIVDIQKYSINFHPKFLNLNTQKQIFFNKPKINVELYNLSEQELQAEQLDEYLLSIGCRRTYTDNKNDLSFSLNRFSNIYLEEFFEKYKEIEQEIKAKAKLDALKSDSRLPIKLKRFKDENGNENIIENELYDNFNIQSNFQPSIIKRRIDYNIENDYKMGARKHQSDDIFNFSNEAFIPFEEDKLFNFEYKEKEIINPYKLDNKNEINNFVKSINVYGLRPCFNQIGEFVTLGNFNSKNHRYSLNVNKIIPNKNLINDDKLPKNFKKSDKLDAEEKNNEMMIDDKISNINNDLLLYNKNKNSSNNIFEFSGNTANQNLKYRNISNYESSVLQDYLNQTICSFQDLILCKLHKHPQNLDNNNKQNDLDIENHRINPKRLSNKQFLNFVSKYRIDLCFDVFDYTKIMWDYLIKLSKAREKFTSVYKCDEVTEVIANLDREISSLKLFTNLFLNCYIDLNQINSLSNYKNFANLSNNLFLLNFSKSTLLETQRLRKKRLLDWLIYETRNAKIINEQTSFYLKKKSDLQTKENRKNLYQVIFYCLLNGRFKTALEYTNNNKLYNLSGLISQVFINPGMNNIKLFKEHILKFTSQYQDTYLNYIYEILTFFNIESLNDVKNSKAPNQIAKDVNHQNNNNQGNFSFRSSDNNQEPNTNIYSQNIPAGINNQFFGNLNGNSNNTNMMIEDNLVDNNQNDVYGKEILKNLNWKQFFICSGLYSFKSSSHIDDLVENYIRVREEYGKIYPNIKSSSENKNKAEDLNMLLLEYYTNIHKQKKYEFKFLSQLFLQKNIFSKFSDMHLHFIICTILLNTIIENYHGDTHKNVSNDVYELRKIQYKLLIRINEDLMISGNVLAALNNVLISNIENKSKITLINDIIYKFVNIDLNIFKSHNILNVFEQVNSQSYYDALAIRHYSTFDIDKAIKYFKLSENFERLHDVNIYLNIGLY